MLLYGDILLTYNVHVIIMSSLCNMIICTVTKIIKEVMSDVQ